MICIKKWIKTGLTDLWQVSGRNNITDFNEVVRLDSEYIRTRSIWNDIKILIKTLKVVVANAQKPSTAANWTRLDPNVKCSGEVSMKLDGGNNIHIMYNNEDGQMCYLYGTYKDGSYTWGTEEVVDETGSLSYGNISVVYNGTTYIPAMTWLNKANTANGVKYAYRTVAPAGDTVHKDRWDFMIIPALGNGHYALKENKISIESSNNWSKAADVTDEDYAKVLQNQLAGANANYKATATPATVDSVIAYKTSKAYETAYLKSE